ncbi:MAG: hypothetical protein E6H67_19100 [Betaproteobacteria bacterium]|nr:MAG: hypothetical protein E6H67_19100 [Betaproteobacteria bacterium]
MLSLAASTIALYACLWSTAQAAEDAKGVRYRVEIVAPTPLKGAIQDSLDIVRWQEYAELTPEFFELLVAEAKAQARDAAEAEGYFSATVSADVDGTTTPATVRIRVEPGEPTRIAGVAISVTGPAVTDTPFGGEAIARVRERWSLPKGSIFRQADWTAAKSAAVSALASDRYAAAKLIESEASIDPDTRTADLSITIDSGPPFRFGSLEVSGLKKYTEDKVRNLSTFAAGDPFTQVSLNAFLRRLNSSGYFASAQATLDADPSHADAAPVHVTVIEAPRRKFTTGVGFSTDTLYRGQLSYDDVNLDGDGLQLHADIRAEAKVQNATLRFVLPPRVPEYTDSFGASLEHTDISGLAMEDLLFGWKRRTADERNQHTYGATYYVSKQQPLNADSQRAHALYFDYGRAWRRVDDLLSPSSGYVINAQVGAAPLGVSSRAFGRTVIQTAGWVAVDLKTQLLLKAEAGAVAASSSHGIPGPLLFRTGGDTTVRGYAYQSLGPRAGDATVPGRYYAIATAEIVRWFGASWGLATFVDAGNAADRVRDLKPVYGYGVGARLRTPIGPFRFDVAYGEAAKTVRMHLSVGLSF